MNKKDLNENYTGVCHYCGALFKSNRSSGKFCTDAHRSLYGKDGPMISPMAPDEDGNDFNAGEVLAEIYDYAKDLQVHEDGWSLGYTEENLNELFGYYGPFPTGSHLLIVAGYVVKAEDLSPKGVPVEYFFVKPIALLSKQEKATAVFLSVREGQRTEEMAL